MGEVRLDEGNLGWTLVSLWLLYAISMPAAIGGMSAAGAPLVPPSVKLLDGCENHLWHPAAHR
jgi:hypothetical protein